MDFIKTTSIKLNHYKTFYHSFAFHQNQCTLILMKGINSEK